MKFPSFVAEGTNYKRATQLLRDAKVNQQLKTDPRDDCTGLIDDFLKGEGGNDYTGKTIVEARESDGKLCGLAIYEVGDDHIYLEFICSDCKGTGRLLVDELVRLARAAGKSYIRLSAIPRARGFYEKLGFTKDPDLSSGMMLPVPSKAGRRKTYRRRHRRRAATRRV